MADMRDRLIELLKGAETKVTEQLSRPLELEEWLGIYADHLLANGVILPPCKVGDVVWEHECYYGYNSLWEAHVTPSEVSAICVMTDNDYYPLDRVGKDVFLTREEAEKALREKENVQGEG